MASEEFLKVGDINISYISEGSGDVILFIHGLSGCKEEWEYTIPYFADNYKAIAIDLPGSGHSDKPLVEYTIDFYSDSVKGFLDEMEIEKAIIVGNSMGGLVSQSLTLKYPEKVDKLILVDSAGINPMRGRAQTSLSLNTDAISKQKGFSPAMIKMTKKMLFYKPCDALDTIIERAISDLKRDDHPEAFRAILSSMENIVKADLSERLGEINQPTLIVWGENDKLMGPKVAEILEGKIRGSEVVIISECGHCPMLEKPDEFNSFVFSFLS